MNKNVSVGENGYWLERGWKWKVHCDPMLNNFVSLAELEVLEELPVGISLMLYTPDRAIWPFEVGNHFLLSFAI